MYGMSVTKVVHHALVHAVWIGGQCGDGRLEHAGRDRSDLLKLPIVSTYECDRSAPQRLVTQLIFDKKQTAVNADR